MDAASITIEALGSAHHEVLTALRAAGPVTWVPAVGGWVVTTRAAGVAVMRDDVTFTVDDPRFSTAQVIGPSMLSRDGPEHRRHRDPFTAAFRPSEVTRRFAAPVEQMAHRLVAELAPAGAADLCSQLARPLAVGVVALSLGLESIDPACLGEWYDEIVAAVERVSFGAPIGEAAAEAFGLLGVALDAAAHAPDSVVLAAAAELSRDELVSNAAVFLFGGIETSEAMTANLLFHLLADRHQFQLVGDDRSLLDAAVEESLRLEPAAARVDRYATRDVNLGGASVRAGDLVVVSIAAANRDPDVFDRPDQFDLARENAHAHLAFAHGPHACLGAQLARMETRAAVMALIDLVPQLVLAEQEPPTGIVFRKPRRLLARWTPTAD
jgi:cytochrome P450